MKLISRKMYYLILLIVFVFFLGYRLLLMGGNHKKNIFLKEFQSNVSSVNIQAETIKIMQEYIDDFVSGIETNNSQMVSELTDEDGFILWRTFLTGFGTRGKEIFKTIRRSEIPKDLIFSVEGEEAISLRKEFKGLNGKVPQNKIISTRIVLNWEELSRPELLHNLSMIIGDEEDLEEAI